MIVDAVAMAAGALTRNKMRSLLTSLGIIIGIASVILIVHLGRAASRSVTNTIGGLGSNMLTIVPARLGRDESGRRQIGPPFEPSDLEAIRLGVPGATVAPVISTRATAQYKSSSRDASITGSTDDYLSIRSWQVEAGRAFRDEELAAGRPVCLLGSSIARELYGERSPIGTTLRLGRNRCQVIGTLAEKGGSLGSDQDETIVMPWRAVQRRFTGKRELSAIVVGVERASEVARVRAGIEALLRARRGPTDRDDFEVRDLREILDALGKITGTLTTLLGAIAAISLLVGSIGIMNIMLVSVTERTREIGVRLAIGATSRDIQLQFLVEASVLSAAGGAIGALLGVGGSWAAASALELPFELSGTAVVASVGFSACIGVAFGYFPARKAARLNPIEALRHE